MFILDQGYSYRGPPEASIILIPIIIIWFNNGACFKRIEMSGQQPVFAVACPVLFNIGCSNKLYFT